MDTADKYLSRVQASAENLAVQLRQKSNAPLEMYIDTTGMQAIIDGLSIDPACVTRDDLTRILIIRDGVHDALHKAQDGQDEHGHSIEQLLNSISRLYVDVERLVQHNDHAVSEAKAVVDSLAATNRGLVQPSVSREVSEQANSIITNVNITQRTINLNILSFDVGTINLVKEFKMNIKRLSASVFAIRLNFDMGVVFEGTIRFLNEGVDKIITDIIKFSEFVSEKYKKVEDLIDSISPIIDKGTRFVKFIGQVIKDIFNGDNEEIKEVRFSLQSKVGSPAVTCAAIAAGGDVLFAGRRGMTGTYTKRTGQFLRLPTPSQDDIHAVTLLPRGLGYVAGTSEGLLWVQGVDRNRGTVRSSFSEHIAAVQVMDWGGAGAAIVSGSKNGHLRRWTLSGGLSSYRNGAKITAGKFGKCVYAITRWNDKIVAAVDEKVLVLDENLEVQSEVPIDRPIRAMCTFSNESVVIVGTGLLAEVNLARGAYNRMITVSPSTEYVAVQPLAERVAVVGTANGTIRAIDINSGAEIGELLTDLALRGLAVSGNIVFAYGGPWRTDGSSILRILWKEELAQ
ncbi:hypothetical protein CN184_29970 [Sinorhizobium medicae]|uniref:hypothetical protein n=1 Tax=Sinorhizobium medicae TaxID=110321 RepID=UPI000FD59922|nr:hypothetical protein [Sinorhizobium medicae]RVJ15945.1 hypothetical protein CN184_29970 [Sinorhizobium medicae]